MLSLLEDLLFLLLGLLSEFILQLFFPLKKFLDEIVKLLFDLLLLGFGCFLDIDLDLSNQQERVLNVLFRLVGGLDHLFDLLLFLLDHNSNRFTRVLGVSHEARRADRTGTAPAEDVELFGGMVQTHLGLLDRDDIGAGGLDH